MQGYGLAWSGFREGYLLSGSDDAQICLWDINAANSKMLGAMAIYHQHLGVVEVPAYLHSDPGAHVALSYIWPALGGAL